MLGLSLGALSGSWWVSMNFTVNPLDALFDALGVSTAARPGQVAISDDATGSVLTITGDADFSIKFAGVNLNLGGTGAAGEFDAAALLMTFGIDVGTL